MKNDIIHLLEKVNIDFNGELVPGNIYTYAEKILKHAHIECVYLRKNLIAFLAYYDNDPKQEKAFLSMIVVHNDYVGNGYGKSLMKKAISNLKEKGFRSFELEVLRSNQKAIEFYKQFNFKMIKPINDFKYLMEKKLCEC